MKTYQNKMKTHSILDKLENKFAKGYKFTVEEIIKEYFSPKNPFGHLMAERRVRSWMAQMKKRFSMVKKSFGCLDELGNYGVPTTEEEGRYIMIRYYNLEKGINVNARKTMIDLADRKLLPKTKEEGIKLLKVINGEK